ncbi:MAG TPA: tetratricopeptide repeat protein [Caulobacteraceae bacterium]
MSEPGAAGPGADALVRQALAFRNAGADGKAIELLKQALAAQPDHLTAQIQLGATYIDQNKVAPALEVLTAASQQAPNSEIVRRLTALCWLSKSVLPKAREEAEEAVRLDPADGISHTILGRVMLRQQLWRDAEAELRKGAELAPSITYGLIHFGYFLLSRPGRLTEAAEVAEAAGRVAPDEFGVLLLRGDVALKLGRSEEAKDFALWALSQRATSREAIRLLVSVKARQSWWLGLWWRLNSSIWLRLALVAVFIPFGLWLVPAVYMIAGRVIFQRMIEHELRTVKLKPGF